MRTRIWIGLLALTLSAGVGAAGVMVVAERAFTPSPSEASVQATVPGALARTVLLPPAMTPIDPEVPTLREPVSCCPSHERHGADPDPVPREC